MIRPESPDDFDAVHALIKAAFLTALFAEGDEQDFVATLRLTNAYVPRLALIAESQGVLVGHVMLTRMKEGPERLLLLACVCVALSHRKTGIGRQLIEAAHNQAHVLGFKAVILLGEPEFYTRLGYRPAIDFGLHNLNGVEDRYVLARALREGGLDNMAGEILIPT